MGLVNCFFCSTGLIINFFYFVQTEINLLLFFAKEMIRKYLKTIHCNKNLKISKLISFTIQWSSFLHNSCEILRDNQSKSTGLVFFKMMKQKKLTLAIADARNKEFLVQNKVKKSPMFNWALNAPLALIFNSFNNINESFLL